MAMRLPPCIPALGLCGLLACGGDDGAGPGEGALEVVAVTLGSAPDPDGYTVSLGRTGAATWALPSNGSLMIPSLAPGADSLTLSGVAGNCLVGDGLVHPVTIVAGDTARVELSINCPASPLQVTASTTGSDPDQDGYDVTLDGSVQGQLLPNDDVLAFPALGPGAYAIGLSGVSPNCTVSGENPRTVTVDPDHPTTVHFDVACNPSGTLVVNVSASGDPDPDGYVVRLNGGPPAGIGVGGGAFEFLPPGDYTVALSDVAPHCALSGPATATATVVSGDAATVAFTVACGAMAAAAPGRDLVVDAQTEVYLLSADGSRFVNLTNHPDQEYFPAWSPDGGTIGFTSGHDVFDPPTVRHFIPHVFTMNADGSGRAQLTGGVKEEGSSWSPDGGRIGYLGAIADSSLHLFVMDADGGNQRDLAPVDPKSEFLERGSAWAPTGASIAYARTFADQPGIYVTGADGGGPSRLTDGTDFAPAWSPDGNRIAFVRFVEGLGDEVYVVNAAGGGLVQVSTRPGDTDHSLAWSPDGTKVAFALDGSIRFANADGSGSTQLTFGPLAGHPSWSPDGSRIAYFIYGTTDTRLFIMKPDGSGEAPLTPAWALGRPSSPAAWRP
jgi:WD40 repeat protein